MSTQGETTLPPPHVPPAQVSCVVQTLPSSHALPSGLGEQVDGSPVHVQHGSTWQRELQPSPSARLPSSHVQRAAMIPVNPLNVGGPRRMKMMDASMRLPLGMTRPLKMIKLSVKRSESDACQVANGSPSVTVPDGWNEPNVNEIEFPDWVMSIFCVDGSPSSSTSHLPVKSTATLTDGSSTMTAAASPRQMCCGRGASQNDLRCRSHMCAPREPGRFYRRAHGKC